MKTGVLSAGGQGERGEIIMKKKAIVALILFVAIVLANTPVQFGDTSAFAEEKLLPPPYVVADAHFVVAGVVWDEAVVRKMLPPDVKPVKEMTGGINIYQANRGYFIAPYEAVYCWVDIEDFDSTTGAKGRWMLQGAYGPEEKTFLALRKFYGAPTRMGGSRIQETPDGTIRGVGILEGQTFVTIEIQPIRNGWQSISWNLNYLGCVAKSKELIRFEANGVGEFCPAVPISVQVTAPAGDPFAGLQPKKVLWAAEIINGAMALGGPLPVR
jgi:hypothetical protein